MNQCIVLPTLYHDLLKEADIDVSLVIWSDHPLSTYRCMYCVLGSFAVKYRHISSINLASTTSVKDPHTFFPFGINLPCKRGCIRLITNILQTTSCCSSSIAGIHEHLYRHITELLNSGQNLFHISAVISTFHNFDKIYRLTRSDSAFRLKVTKFKSNWMRCTHAVIIDQVCMKPMYGYHHGYW